MEAMLLTLPLFAIVSRTAVHIVNPLLNRTPPAARPAPSYVQLPEG
jgi:hypothetical protein